MSPDLAVLRRIRFLLTDVDGVLTDGRVHYDPSSLRESQAADAEQTQGTGPYETKAFHVHDAAGLVYWHRSGGLSGLLSGRTSEVVAHRARELGIHELHLGHLDKLPVFEGILERHGLQADEVCYIGDDVLDLPILTRAGLAVAPPEARPDVRCAVHLVTEARAGFGAVRDVIELLMRAQGTWEAVLEGGGRPMSAETDPGGSGSAAQ